MIVGDFWAKLSRAAPAHFLKIAGVAFGMKRCLCFDYVITNAVASPVDG